MDGAYPEHDVRVERQQRSETDNGMVESCQEGNGTGGAEYQVQEAMNHAVANWGKTFLRDTNAGLRNISQAASMGVQGDLMMMILLLFLQKQNLAFAVYQFGSVLSLPD